MKEMMLVNSVNGAVLAMSYTEVESIFKIGLLAASIVWTLVKTVKALDGKDEKKDDET